MWADIELGFGLNGKDEINKINVDLFIAQSRRTASILFENRKAAEPQPKGRQTESWQDRIMGTKHEGEIFSEKQGIGLLLHKTS